MPHADLELCYADAVGLAARLRRRELSAVDVVRNVIARLEATQPQLNAFTHVDAEGALAAARDCDRRLARGDDVPPLCGVPVSVKELIEVRGMPCSYGSRTLAGHLPEEDAPSVARLRAAGAIIVGMTNTSEFGFRGYTDNLLHGVTRNPWDLTRSPGGSSGGAASSVAAGVTPIALGTDGGGSIRNPASFTGLVGIKPQFGRVPVYPPSATLTLAHVGPLARTVRDAVALLEIIAGPDPRDWTSLQPLLRAGAAAAATRPLRIAFSTTLGYGHIEPDVRAVIEAAVRGIDGLAGPIEPVEHVCEDESELFVAEFIGGCSARLGDAVVERPDDIDPLLLRQIVAFRAMTADHYTRLLRRRALFRDHMRRFFERWDVLITPMTPAAALRLGERAPAGYESHRLWTFFGYPFNLTGQPAASLPCGFAASGLPVGMQIVVPPQREDLLIELLRRFDDALRCTGRRPAL